MRPHSSWLALLALAASPTWEMVSPGFTELADPGPYAPGLVMVAPPSGVGLPELADRVGGVVVQPVGASGYGVMEADDDALRLLDEAEVCWSRLGVVLGTGRPTPTRSPAAWQLGELGLEGTGDGAGVVVAILDSGVAYEDLGRFRAARGLRHTTFVAPADFVEMDGHPDDDHQHGTHLASLIASDGPFPGVAPGVSIMPVKVLDAHNRGTEWSLVEGLHHAIENGADVINLSLSFPLGYVPSPALEQALERAWDAGVVVVAASGNDGAHELSWPAASRVVVAVGASMSDPGSRRFQAESYSNVSPALDVLAPGGSLDRDADRDGWPDGLLAETIDPSDPGRLGFWFYEGTSQAAALVSGAAARLLASGIAPRDVAASLQSGAGGYDPQEVSLTGSGAGPVDVGAAVQRPATHRDVYAGLLPYLTSGGPRARVAVVDEGGQPVVDAPVVGTVSSATEVQWWSCRTDGEGRCDLAGPGWGPATDAWAFRVDAVVLDGVAQRPSRAVFASDAAAVLLAAIAQAPEAAGGVVAVHWSAGRDQVLEVNLQDAWAVVDSGTGLLSSPLGLLFDTRHLAGIADTGQIDLDLDGTGLLSSPLGVRVTTSTLWIDGSGLLSSPLGLRSSLLLVGIEGSGLLSSPLGFHASDLYVLGGSGLISSPLGLGYWGQVLLLDSASLLGSSVESSPFQGLADGSLTRDAAGLEPATWLVASGSVSVGLAAAPPPGRGPVDRPPVPYRP